MFELQGGDAGPSSVPIVQTPIVPVPVAAGLSQTPAPANTMMEVSSASKEEEGADEDLVSIYNAIDVAQVTEDHLEYSVHSRISHSAERRHRNRIAQLQREFNARKLREPIVSLQRYSSDSEVSIPSHGPQIQDTCHCARNVIQGRQEVVIIHLSSDSEEDVQID